MSISWKPLIWTCLVFLSIGPVTSCERRKAKAKVCGRDMAIQHASREIGLAFSDIEKMYRIVSDTGAIKGVEHFDFYLRSIWSVHDASELFSDQSETPMFFTVSIDVQKDELVDFQYLEDSIGQGVGMPERERSNKEANETAVE